MKKAAVEGAKQIPLPGVVQWVNLGDLRPNPWQPRVHRDEAKFLELVDSIEKHQLYHNLLGRFKEGVIEIADGHQRWEAYKVLQAKVPGRYDRIPVDIREIPDQEMADIAIETNEKRQGLNAIDLARFFVRYMADFKIAQKEVAARFGISQPAVANAIRLLELPDKVQDKIISQEITATHGRELLRIKHDPKLQVELAEEAVKEKASVAALQEEIARSVRQTGRRLGDEAWPRAEFNTKACKTCEHRQMIVDFGRRGEVPYCMNPQCWDDKQKVAKDEKAVEEQKRIDALAKEDVVDLASLMSDHYQEFWSTGERKWVKENCKDCEHLKQGKHRGGDVNTVCLKPSCYCKKKSAITREKNKTLEQEFETLLAEAKRTVDVSKPLPSAVCHTLLRAILTYDQEKLIAKELGVQTKGYEVRTALDKRLQELDVETLRWYVIEGTVLKLFGGKYRNDNKDMANFVKSLAGLRNQPARRPRQPLRMPRSVRSAIGHQAVKLAARSASSNVMGSRPAD